MNANLKAIAIGRLVPVKQFNLLIEAWQDVPNQLSIVGDGAESHKLQLLAKKLGLQDRIHFLGERSDVPDLLADHQLLVATSEREGFGYVLLEALQARLVVISTATGVAVDLLPRDYLIESASVSSVSLTIKQILANFDQAKLDFKPVWNHAQTMTVRKMVLETLACYRHSQTRRSHIKH